MECIIIFRNPWNKRVGFITDGDGEDPMVYADEDHAQRDVPNIPILRAASYQIVPLDEI